MHNRLYKFLVAFLIVITSLPSLACAVCYTDNGMSGASIALIVIILSFLILFFIYRIFTRTLNRD